MTFYNDTVLADSPVVYYKLDEASGTPANAGSSSDTATKGAGITQNVTGINGGGKAVTSAGGTTGYITSTLSGTPWSDKVWSIEWWMKDGASTKDLNAYYGPSSGFGTITNGTGKLVFTIYGGTTNAALTSTTTVTGSGWKHIVVTSNGNDFRLYVNGTQEASSTTNIGTFAPSTTLYLLSNLSTAGAFSMDEFAFYDSALSSTRVSAHYSAGNTTPVNGGFSPTPMTASVAVPGGVKVVDVSVAGGPLTASATMPGGTGGLAEPLQASRDWASSTGYSTTTLGVSTFGSGSIDHAAIIDFELPSHLATDAVDSAVLSLYVTTAHTGAGTFGVKPILSEYSNQQVTGLTLGTEIAFTKTGTGAIDIDVTTIVDYSTFYGLYVYAKAGTSVDAAFASSENATTGNRPVLTIKSHTVSTPANVSADPMVADETMPTADIGITEINAAAPLAASASMPTPVVTGVRHASETAEPMAASMEAGQFNGFSVPITLTAGVLEASVASVDVAVATTRGATEHATPMTATADWEAPTVNGAPVVINESEDSYFVRVDDLDPNIWWRLNDTGSSVKDRVSGNSIGTPSGTYRNGVLVNHHDGPEGRASVKFVQGSFIEQNEPTLNNADETTFVGTSSIVKTTLEFSFRTDKANEFLMAGADQTITSAGVASPAGATELFLQDGKIGYRTWQYGFINQGGTNSINKEFVGFTALNDGQWHSVVVRSGIKSKAEFGLRDEYGVEIWVDGKFEIRRYFTQSWIGMPDYVGGRPAIFDTAILPQLPLSQYFEGDMSEIVWYIGTDLTTEDISRNYYAFMGWKPIAPEPMEAFAFTPAGTKGGGNQKKALYLYFSGQDEVFGGMPGGANQSVSESLSFDPMPDMAADSFAAPNSPRTSEQVGDFFGFKVFTKSTHINYSPSGVTSYRDPATDEQSLINLEYDIDLTDYDVIMFKDWPDEGYERDWYEAVYPGQLERLLGQLRDANDRGIGLYVTNPRLAVDLGVVDRIEFVPTLRESKVVDSQGNAMGLYDYASALVFPWNIVATDGLTGGVFAIGTGVAEDLSDSFLSNKAYFYLDTHKNDRFRVRALVEGLTDIPSYMLEESIFHVDYDQFGWQGWAGKYLKRDDGLQIGDEYIFNGAEIIAASFQNTVEKRYQRYNGTWATPSGHVKAGTIVTTFGATYWVGKQQATNPYADYVTTVVLQPGDTLAGRPVGGRIFVNFSEQPSEGLSLISQVLPDEDNNVVYPRDYQPETTAQREWDYSWTRTSLVTTGQSTTVGTVTVQLPDGTTTSVALGAGADNNLSMVRSHQLFPLMGHAHYQMDGRGILWLAAAPEIGDGDNIVRTTAVTATAEMPNPTLHAEKSQSVTVQAMSGLAELVAPLEAHDDDTTVRVLPMTAEASFTNYGKTLSAQPMLADAEMVENFNMVRSMGEQIALTLHGVDTVLYFKEEE